MNAAPTEAIVAGDRVLVDTSAYGVPGTHWCYVTHIAPGSAAVYPIKVRIPARGEGQYKAAEILDHQATGERLP